MYFPLLSVSLTSLYSCRKTPKPWRPKWGRKFGPRWGRSTSTTRSCTTPSSNGRSNRSSRYTGTCIMRCACVTWCLYQLWWHWSISNSRLVVVCQGKEFETRLKEKKPGDLSGELRIALGMPTGPVSASSCSALHNKAFPFCTKQLLFCSVKVQESCSDTYVILCVILAVLCLRRTLIKFLRRGWSPCRDTDLHPHIRTWRSPASTPPSLRSDTHSNTERKKCWEMLLL